jgi:D-proline reductase (dithiol) PrdB
VFGRIGAFWQQKIIGKAAESMVLHIDSHPAIAPVQKSLSECRVALVTTAGVHLKSQPTFDVKSGDSSYRPIPDFTPVSELTISHTHYDRTDADKDVNCVFPMTRLHELVKDGIIGSAASVHYGFMGYIPKPQSLIKHIAPEIASYLKQDGVDVVVLSPG